MPTSFPARFGFRSIADGVPLDGYIDSSGTVVIPPRYYAGGAFSEGLAHVIVNEAEGQGFIDVHGEIVISPTFAFAYGFHGGVAGVFIDDRAAGYVNREGRMTIPARFLKVMDFSEGLAGVAAGPPDGVKWGFLDQSGNEAIRMEFERVGAFSGGLAWAERGGRKGYIDSRSDFKIDLPAVSSGGCFHDGVASVCFADEGWGYVWADGSIAIEPEYTFACGVTQGMCLVGTKEGLGGHLKTGHTGSLQNRPTEPTRTRVVIP